ncbi:hypothetical protein LCGC14_2307500 [marine sediment metagenome]|uniref:Uncharacterized protein n=1 Tax=marine sediment metagenome TaxID=412755 RepID=A0A0F9CLL8_9ZZZZ
MAGRTRYDMCKDMLKAHRGKTLSIHELRSLVIKNIASMDDKVDQYLRLMNSTNLIKEIMNVDTGVGKFEVLG